MAVIQSNLSHLWFCHKSVCFFNVTSNTSSLFFRLFFSLGDVLLCGGCFFIDPRAPSSFLHTSECVLIPVLLYCYFLKDAFAFTFCSPSFKKYICIPFCAVIVSVNWMFKQINSSSWTLFFHDVPVCESFSLIRLLVVWIMFSSSFPGRIMNVKT